jgi:hypothetical protein
VPSLLLFDFTSGLVPSILLFDFISGLVLSLLLFDMGKIYFAGSAGFTDFYIDIAKTINYFYMVNIFTTQTYARYITGGEFR